MTSNTLDTPKVSAGFDINAQFRSVMHDLGLSPEDTKLGLTSRVQLVQEAARHA
jgi:hypothetical protein